MQILVNLLSNALKFSNTGSKISVALKILETHVLASGEVISSSEKELNEDSNH